MTPEEITALAREYAEEVYRNAHKEMEVLPNCLSNEAINMFAEDMEIKLKWLLRRYCLVEKGKVNNIHKGVLVQLDPKSFGYSPYNQGRMDVMKSLFPEIRKDAEG